MVDAIGSATAPTYPPAQGGRGQPADSQGPDGRRSGPTGPAGRQLTPAQLREVEDLQQRDRDVRNHEAAHQAAGAGLAGGATFTYQSGPDGRQYAVGGEVSIDISRERDPQATITKMQRVIAAALAPADPSSQDRSVAAHAQAIQLQAEQELAKQATGGGDAGGTQQAAADGGGQAGGQDAVSRAYGGGSSAATGGLLDLVA